MRTSNIQRSLGADWFRWHLCACLSLHWWLCSHHSPSPYPPLLSSDPTSPVSSFPDHDHWGGFPLPRSWAHGGETYDGRAAAPTLFVLTLFVLTLFVSKLFVFVLTSTCTMLNQDFTPGPTLTQHPCMQPHFTPTSSPPTQFHLIALSVLAINSLPVRTPAPTVAKESATIYIHSTHSINTRKHPTHAPLGNVYTRALVVPPSSPHQRAFVCGACTGTAQVDVSLVSLRLSMQLSLTLACIKALSKTLLNIHGASHVPAPRLTSTSSCRRRWLNFSTVPQERLFFNNHQAKFFLRAPWGKPLLGGMHHDVFSVFLSVFFFSFFSFYFILRE